LTGSQVGAASRAIPSAPGPTAAQQTSAPSRAPTVATRGGRAAPRHRRDSHTHLRRARRRSQDRPGVAAVRFGVPLAAAILGIRSSNWASATWPNPTDRGRPGTKCHLITDRRRIPLAFRRTRGQCPHSLRTQARHPPWLHLPRMLSLPPTRPGETAFEPRSKRRATGPHPENPSWLE
jgi:hypothetical protein